MVLYKNLNSALYLTPKLLYIVVNMEYFAFYSFRHPFLMSKKVSSTMIVVTFALMQFITFFSNIGMALLADNIQRPKAVLVACLILAACSFQLMFLPGPAILCCAYFILYSTFIYSTVPLLDRIILDYLQRKNAPSSLYGKQRMFGTFTYFVTNYITEALVYSSAATDEENFGRLQPLYVFYAILAAGLVFLLAPVDRVRATTAQERDPPQIGRVLKNKAYLFFLFIILLNGVTRGMMTVFLTSYYKKILNFNDLSVPSSVPKYVQPLVSVFYKNPVSTCNTFGVILEIAIFFMSQPLLRTFGLYWAFLISQVAQCARFLFYSKLSPSYAYRFEAACGIELLKGVNFGFTHLSAVQLAVLLVPSNLKTTSQMIYAGTFVCLGGMFGSLIGFLYKIDTADGSYSMFISGAALSLIAVLLIVVKYGVVDRRLWGADTRIPEAPKSEPSSKQASSSDLSAQPPNNGFSQKEKKIEV